MKKKAQVRTDRRGRKSRSVEEIGFGLTRRNKKDEGEEEVGGQQSGRRRGVRAEINGSVGQQGMTVEN